MPRSSRHRSHRSHRRGSSVERSESEGEAVSAREEAAAAARVSRDPEPERRKSAGKEVGGSGNCYAEHGKKRKERAEEMMVDVVSDRWNSGVCEEHLVEKSAKSEVFGPVDVEKPAVKLKGCGDESKRSGRRTAGLDERVEEFSSKSDSGKRRLEKEKDLGRRESSEHYKEDRDKDRDREREKEREKEWERQKERERERGREREREREKDREREKEREREREKEREKERDRERERERPRDRERDRKDYDTKHERYEDSSSRKNGTKMSRTEEGYRRELEINENTAKDKYYNADKELDKHSRRKGDDSEDKDKWPADIRDSDDRKTLVRGDRANKISKDQRFDDEKHKEKYKDDIEREKYRDDMDRDKRQRDDKRLDGRSTRIHASDRADYRSVKDGNRTSESRYRKDKIHDNDYYDDYGNKHKENRGRKRPPEENDDQDDLKPQSAQEQRENLEKTSGSERLDSLIGRTRSDHRNLENFDSSPNKIYAKSSPSSSPYHDKDQSWHRSKLTDHSKRELPYEERNIRPRTSSGRERTPASRLRDRDADNWSAEKLKQKDDAQSRDLMLEVSASSHYDRTPRKDMHVSPKQLREKSPSSSEQRFSSRHSGARILDGKGQRSSFTKFGDRDGDLTLERSLHEDRPPAKVLNREPTPAGSSMSRGGHFSGSSPNQLPPPPARHRGDDSSFLGSHDDDRRLQNGDRRFHSHHKRNDMNSVRGHGHAWNNPPSWPSLVANGFVSIQHGAPGFHPPLHQFPAPHMFNLRPPMKLNQAGVSYPMHEAVDRFSSHARPFGWHNPLDEPCPPHLQVWNGSSGVFGGEPYMYGRQEWDQNRPHAGSRGWEVTGEALKGQSEMPDIELPVAKKEPESSATPVEPSGGQHSRNPWVEQKELENLTPENVEAKDHLKHAFRTPEVTHGATLVPSILSRNGTAAFCKSYLSRINVSHDLVESELYKKCLSLLGDLDMAKGPKVIRSGLPQQNIGKIEKAAGKYGSSNLLSSLFLRDNDAVFQRAMALHKNQTEKLVMPTYAFLQTEGKRGLPEVNHDKVETGDHALPKESSVSTCALHPSTDTMEEEVPPLKQEPDHVMEEAPPVITESDDGVEAPSAITEPDGVMEEEPAAITEPDGVMEEAPPVITKPDGDMDVVVPSAIVEPAESFKEEAPPAFGEPSSRMKDVHAVANAFAGRQESTHANAEKYMEEEANKFSGDNVGDGEAKPSSFVSDVAASDTQDSEALLVESRVNLSRIPNSPESTH